MRSCSDQNCLISNTMIQQLGNVNNWWNCLLWSKPWRGPRDWAKLQGRQCQQDAPLPWTRGRGWLHQQMTSVTFGFCSAHTFGLGLMALCRELQLSKQKNALPCSNGSHYSKAQAFIWAPAAALQVRLPIKQLANEKTLLPGGGLWAFCCSCCPLLWIVFAF